MLKCPSQIQRACLKASALVREEIFADVRSKDLRFVQEVLAAFDHSGAPRERLGYLCALQAKRLCQTRMLTLSLNLGVNARLLTTNSHSQPLHLNSHRDQVAETT